MSHAHKQPLRSAEVISVFYKEQCTYNPQDLVPYRKVKKRGVGAKTNRVAGTTNWQEYTGYPDQVLRFDRDLPSIHPTQKPVALLEYLICTYTNEFETVLDNTMGSGSTGEACIKTNRNFIGIEKDKKCFEIAEKRINTTRE